MWQGLPTLNQPTACCTGFSQSKNDLYSLEEWPVSLHTCLRLQATCMAEAATFMYLWSAASLVA